ncbi:hypothetical protein KIPB_010284, partial [Kipferlia bialata]
LRGASFVYSRQVAQAILPQPLNSLSLKHADRSEATVPVLDGDSVAVLKSVMNTYPRERFHSKSGYSDFARDILGGLRYLSCLPANRPLLVTGVEELYMWIPSEVWGDVARAQWLCILRNLTETAELCPLVLGSEVLTASLSALRCLSLVSDRTNKEWEDMCLVFVRLLRTDKGDKGDKKAQGEHPVRAQLKEILTKAIPSIVAAIPRLVTSATAVHAVLSLLEHQADRGEIANGSDETHITMGTLRHLPLILDTHNENTDIVLMVAKCLIPSPLDCGTDIPLDEAFAEQFFSCVRKAFHDASFCGEFLSVLNLYLRQWECNHEETFISDLEYYGLVKDLPQLHPADSRVVCKCAGVVGHCTYLSRKTPDLAVPMVTSVLDAYDRYPGSRYVQEAVLRVGCCVRGTDAASVECGFYHEGAGFPTSVVAGVSALLTERHYAESCITILGVPHQDILDRAAYDGFLEYGATCGVGPGGRHQDAWVPFVDHGLMEALVGLLVFAIDDTSNGGDNEVAVSSAALAAHVIISAIDRNGAAATRFNACRRLLRGFEPTCAGWLEDHAPLLTRRLKYEISRTGLEL